MNIHEYDYYIVAFSGGKDSTACVLWLLDQGVDKSKIELWHHHIDGDGPTLMDWECTPGYCEAFARAFNLTYYSSYKEGGFMREMLRADERTAPTHFETPEGWLSAGGTRGKKSTRMKFPQISADLSVRWCSAYLKIDVGTTAINNQMRFRGKKTVVISGERAQESASRARYNDFEPDRADLRNGKKYQRHVDRLRPILRKSEEWVWQIIERYKVVAHPAYYLGWNRVSCKFCIFGSPDQFASAAHVSPELMEVVYSFEDDFGVTMKRNMPLSDYVAKGKVYDQVLNLKELVIEATTEGYTGPIFTENWELPAGAFGEGCGPT